jgi:8-oxo-dGTP pyrophosphatase MutT (NUDIX family)
VCANCGGIGHIYRNCNHPITSYGIIAIQLVRVNESFKPFYLMVQRKDSLSYVEFLRGKYELENRKYILKLLSNMTKVEQQRLLKHDFDFLWKSLWQIRDCKTFFKEYLDSKRKFMSLIHGYLLQTETDGLVYIDMKQLLQGISTGLLETEWGFPKGRRNINEDYFDCALREFIEETGIPHKCLQICTGIKPLEEVFSGSNYVRYRHIYYIAFLKSAVQFPKKLCKEIKTCAWFDFEQALEKIGEGNTARKELFKRVHRTIMKKLI